MVYSPRPQIRFPTASLDAFGRLRVSSPSLLLDLKRVGGTPDHLATNHTVGTGTADYDADRVSTLLSVAATSDSAVRQSKSRGVYQPGKSLQSFQSFVFGAASTNVIKRVGYFDDKNGAFLQQDSTGVYCVVRSSVSGSPVDTAVEQANWNVDPMDGSGPSGITLDATKAQILMMDLEYLGVGDVRFYLVIGGQSIFVHHQYHANILDVVYMSNCNLPLRWGVRATGTPSGGATSIEAICGSLVSEGGYEVTGITASCDSGTAGNSISAGSHEEILAIRLQSSYTEFATAFVKALGAINTTGADFRWRLVLNPTETVAGTWSAVEGSVIEKNTTRTVTVDTGVVLDSGFVSSANNQIFQDSRPVLTMGATVTGVADVVSLQIFNLSAQAETFYGSLTWREVF